MSSSRQMGSLSVLPDHLPRRLTIACWLWFWATDRQPGEGFYDLEVAFDALVERGFNAVRIDAMWSWAFDLDGKPRGEVEVGNVAEPGYCDYGPGLTTKGGVRVNALDEIIRLFHLAEERDVYVALTSWEFQRGHSIGCLADPALRDEILSVPGKERFMYLARQCDRLLQAIKQHGLEKRIAYVEIHNELQSVWHSADMEPRYPELREDVEEGLEFLQERHPDILFTDDYQVDIPEDRAFDYNTALAFLDKFASNAQLLDHHLYVLGLQWALYQEAGVRPLIGPDQDAAMERVERENEFLLWLLKPGSPNWREFSQHFTCDWFRNWRPLIYLYQNMDVEKYDYWMFRHYPEWEERMRTYWKNYIQVLSHNARQRNLPIVCDEGYIFWPPMHSVFETSAVGKSNFDFIVDQMLEASYWGIMISTYTFPGQPLWDQEVGWLRKTHDRILAAD